MKTNLILILTFIFFSCYSQNWHPLNNGVNNSSSGGVSQLYSFNQKLFVSGDFTVVDNFSTSSNLVYWDDKKWRVIDTDNIETSKIVEFVTFKDTLYAIGRSSVLERNLHLLKYNEFNNKWTIVPNSVVKQSPNDDGIPRRAYVFRALEYKNELYLVGYFDNVGNTPVRNIVKWDGHNWNLVLDDNYSEIKSFQITSLAIFNNDLIICGKIDSLNNSVYNNLARWNGEKWDNLNDGLITSTLLEAWSITKLAVFNGELYAGGLGVKTTENGIPITLSKYNGQFWEGIKGFEDNAGIVENRIRDLRVFGNHLFISKGNSGQIFFYNGSELNEIEDNFNEKVFSLEVFNDQLYAGGYFHEEGSPNGVAKLGILLNEIEAKKEVHIFPNPTSGVFLMDYELRSNSKFTIEIYDQLGKIVMKKKYNDLKGKYLREFDISNLPKGFYIIYVLSKDFEQTKPIILINRH